MNELRHEVRGGRRKDKLFWFFGGFFYYYFFFSVYFLESKTPTGGERTEIKAESEDEEKRG